VAGIAAHTTDDVGGVVASLWAVVLAVTDLTAVLACLVFVITEGTVERSKLAELVAFQLILTFWDGGSLEKVNSVHGPCWAGELTVSTTL